MPVEGRPVEDDIDGMNANAAETMPQVIMMRAIQSARADSLQEDVRRHFEDEISDEEQAGAEPEGRFTQAERLIHVKLGKADIDAIEIGHEIADDQERNQPPHHLADDTFFQAFHGAHSRSFLQARCESSGRSANYDCGKQQAQRAFSIIRSASG